MLKNSTKMEAKESKSLSLLDLAATLVEMDLLKSFIFFLSF